MHEPCYLAITHLDVREAIETSGLAVIVPLIEGLAVLDLEVVAQCVTGSVSTLEKNQNGSCFKMRISKAA